MPLFEGHKQAGIERLFIEMPDHVKDEVIWKWPDAQVMQHAVVNVDVDYEAVFTNLGQVIGVLPPGRHPLGEGAPLLYSWLVNRLTGNGYYDAEVYFVATRDITGLRFGGPVDNLRDGPSGLVVSVSVFGELAYRVADAATLLTRLAGSSGDVRHDEQIASWVEEQVLAAIRAVLPQLVAGHGVLAMGELQEPTAQAALARANAALSAWGLAVCAFAELNVNVGDEDAAQLKQLAATKAYTGLAGSFEQAVRAEAALEIARGVAGGKVASQDGLVAGVLLGAPVGLAPGLATPAGTSPPAAAAAAAAPGAAPVAQAAPIAPDALGAPGAARGAGFCSACGHALPLQARFCPICGTAVSS
jgi:membrane protease subunit (stomatin/prohibitin family)